MKELELFQGGVGYRHPIVVDVGWTKPTSLMQFAFLGLTFPEEAALASKPRAGESDRNHGTGGLRQHKFTLNDFKTGDTSRRSFDKQHCKMRTEGASDTSFHSKFGV